MFTLKVTLGADLKLVDVRFIVLVMCIVLFLGLDARANDETLRKQVEDGFMLPESVSYSMDFKLYDRTGKVMEAAELSLTRRGRSLKISQSSLVKNYQEVLFPGERVLLTHRNRTFCISRSAMSEYFVLGRTWPIATSAKNVAQIEREMDGGGTLFEYASPGWWPACLILPALQGQEGYLLSRDTPSDNASLCVTADPFAIFDAFREPKRFQFRFDQDGRVVFFAFGLDAMHPSQVSRMTYRYNSAGQFVGFKNEFADGETVHAYCEGIVRDYSLEPVAESEFLLETYGLRNPYWNVPIGYLIGIFVVLCGGGFWFMKRRRALQGAVR